MNSNKDNFEIFKKVFNKIDYGFIVLNSFEKVVFVNKYFVKNVLGIKQLTYNKIATYEDEAFILNKIKLTTVINNNKDISLYNILFINKKLKKCVIKKYNFYETNKNTYENKDFIYFDINKFKIIYKKEKFTIFVFQDVSRIKRLELKLHKQIKEINKKLKYAEMLASIDPLTQIYNRYKFYDECNKLINLFIRYGTIFSIIMFDIDNFKLINDNFGHLVGDYVLKKLSEIVQSTIRKTDIFFRWGGDEFIIILPNTKLDGAFISAEKIREVISKNNFSTDKKKIGKITCSFGVSMIEKGMDCDELTKKIDKAMYHAKNSGRNRVYKI